LLKRPFEKKESSAKERKKPLGQGFNTLLTLKNDGINKEQKFAFLKVYCLQYRKN
jgi:hypothetical protein